MKTTVPELLTVPYAKHFLFLIRRDCHRDAYCHKSQLPRILEGTTFHTDNKFVLVEDNLFSPIILMCMHQLVNIKDLFALI